MDADLEAAPLGRLTIGVFVPVFIDSPEEEPFLLIVLVTVT